MYRLYFGNVSTIVEYTARTQNFKHQILCYPHTHPHLAAYVSYIRKGKIFIQGGGGGKGEIDPHTYAVA